MEDFADRYGSRFIKLVDSGASGREFEFDRALLMPTAAGYRALVEQARTEIKTRIMKYFSRRWSDGAIVIHFLCYRQVQPKSNRRPVIRSVPGGRPTGKSEEPISSILNRITLQE